MFSAELVNMSGTGRILGRRLPLLWFRISGLKRFGLSPPRGTSRWLPVQPSDDAKAPPRFAAKPKFPPAPGDGVAGGTGLLDSDPSIFTVGQMKQYQTLELKVLTVQKVLSGCGHAGRLRLRGKYIGHRLVA